MRIFLAGATGAIGRRLLPLLVAEGHQVTGLTRTATKAPAIEAQGAEPVVADALDGPAIERAVQAARPDAVIHELTAIPARLDPRRIKRDFVATNLLRSEGTRVLAGAARGAGVARMISQSLAPAYAPAADGRLRRESDPLFLDAPAAYRSTVEALAALERTVQTMPEGVVLRYGFFYGPGTGIAPGGSIAEQVRARRFPIVGRGGGVWSFIHVDDAARATLAALTAPPGTYNVVDDDPAPVAQWLPELADALGAPAPRHVPTLLARLLAGPYGVITMTRASGASNELARRQLGWAPQFESWRRGFRAALA